MFFEIIFGGPYSGLSFPVVGSHGTGRCFVVGVVASSYPASIVMKMPPVKAMQRMERMGMIGVILKISARNVCGRRSAVSSWLGPLLLECL